MGYCPFSSLSHDTMDCIVTQGAGACSSGATARLGGPATRPTARKGVRQRARDLASGGVVIQMLYHGWR